MSSAAVVSVRSKPVERGFSTFGIPGLFACESDAVACKLGDRNAEVEILFAALLVLVDMISKSCSEPRGNTLCEALLFHAVRRFVVDSDPGSLALAALSGQGCAIAKAWADLTRRRTGRD